MLQNGKTTRVLNTRMRTVGSYSAGTYVVLTLNDLK